MSMTEYAVLITGVVLMGNIAMTDLSSSVTHTYSSLGQQIEQLAIQPSHK